MFRAITLILLAQACLFAQNLKVVDQWGEGGATAMLRLDDVFFTVGGEHGLTVYRYDKGLFTVLGEAVFPSRLNDEASTFHTLAYHGQKVFAGSSTGVFSFDVSDLNQPVPLKQYFLGNILQIATMGDQLIVLLSSGVQFFDLTSPTLELQASVDLNDGKAFLLEESAFWVVDADGIKHIDLTNPMAPLANLVYAMGQLEGPLLRYFDRLLVPSGSDLAVFDITDPQTPIFQHTTPTEISPVSDLVQAPGGLYVLGGSQGKGTCRYFSVDIDTQLVPVYRLHLMGARGQMQRVDGKLAFTSTTNGLVIVTEDPGSAPELIAESSFSGVCGLELDNTVGYVSDSNGIHVIDLNSTGTMTQLHQFGPGLSKIALTGGTLASAIPYQSLTAYNVTDPLNPQTTINLLLTHDVTQVKANEYYLGAMGPTQLTFADNQALWGSNTYTEDPGRLMSFSFDAQRLRFLVDTDPAQIVTATSTNRGFGGISGIKIDRDIKDLFTKDSTSFTIGKDISMFNGFFYNLNRRLEDIDGTVIKFDGSSYWLDGLGYGSFEDLTNIGVRRFEIQQQGALAAFENKGLVQDGDKVSLYDLSEMTKPQIEQVDLPNKVLRVFRDGHDLWVTVATGIYHLSDQNGRLEQISFVDLRDLSISDAIVNGNIAYVITWGTLQSVDISDPNHPILLDAVFADPFFENKINFADDNHIITDDGTLIKYNISDPGNMQLAAQANFSPTSTAFIDDEFIYFFEDFSIITILSKADLSLVVQIPVNTDSSMIKVGNLIYYADYSTLRISAIDITDPINPVFHSVSGPIIQDIIYSDGSRIYLSDWRDHDLSVFDASDPLHLTLMETFSSAGEVVDASPDGLYVCRDKGYSLTRLSPCSDASDLSEMISNWPTNTVLELISLLEGRCQP